MPNAMKKQVGGDHYKRLAIKPVEFATVNAYDPCAFSILKYLSRHRHKNGIEDLRKASHFVELRMELLSRTELDHGYDVTPMQKYCDKNRVRAEDYVILMNLHTWVRGIAEVPDEHAAATLIDQIRALAKITYKEDLT